MLNEGFFPDIITDLPQADIPIEGVRSYVIQGTSKQVIFMTFESEVEIPEHSHEAQWGVVLDGKIELTIGGSMQTYKRGDTYYIPSGVRHSARIAAGYKDITLFNQKDRYKLRSNHRKGPAGST